MRVLPFLQAARADDPKLLDCETCMRKTPAEIRQHMACGYEPSVTGAQAWSPDPMLVEMEHCAGYTTRLPDVIDLADMYWWADKGAAGQLKDATPPVRIGLRVLRDAIADCEAKKHRDRQGGGK